MAPSVGGVVVEDPEHAGARASCRLMRSATRRSKGAIPLRASQRPEELGAPQILRGEAVVEDREVYSDS